MKEVYLKIEGRVQRVWFRGWAVKTAIEIGQISGWVRNTEDGNVEILMRGEDDKVNLMIEKCYVGPTLSRVDKISFISGRVNGFLPPIEDGCFYKY